MIKVFASRTTTKKPGVSKLPMVPNKFGVCMVYGRCCTWGAMLSLQILISYEFSCHTAS